MKTVKAYNIRGMTIAELMISLGIFSLVVTTGTAIFVQIIKTSKSVSAKSTAIDNLSLVVEQMAREIRTGKDFSRSVSSDQRTGKNLIFTNYLDEEVTYTFATDSAGSGKITKTVKNGGGTTGPTAITPSGINVEGNFIVTNFNGTTTPRVLVSVVAKDMRGVVLARAQTTVSARLIYYKK